MRTPQSNLSDPQFGYDLVVATTQKSINTMMTAFLDRTQFPQVIGCFVRGAHKHDSWQPIAYEELKAKAKNTDPFCVPDSAGDEDQAVTDLRAAGFKGAFRATIGLPSTETIPPIVTLGKDIDAPVTFNLLCATFQITGFDIDDSWSNKSQPTSGKPWYFSATVKLHSTIIDHQSPNLPAAVATEVKKRLNAGTFSLQQMFLDLDTAADFSTLSFEGLAPLDPIAYLVNATFCKAYLDQMKQNGHPVLGYSFVMDEPDASSFELGALSRESCPFLDQSNNPYDNPTQVQQEAATFNYLCSSTKTPPTANRFKWNWVDTTDLATFDGVVALKCDRFWTVLESTIQQVMENHFCLTADIDFTAENDGVSWRPTFGTGGKSTAKRYPIQTPVKSNEFTPFLQIDYVLKKEAYAPWRLWSDLHEGWRAYVAYNCFLTANASLSIQDNGPVIRLNMNSKLQANYGHYESETFQVWYDNFPLQNYLDYAATIDLPLRVLNAGQLTLDTGVKPYGVQSNNANYETSTGGTLGLGTYTVEWLDRHLKNHVLETQKKTIISCVDNLAQEVADAFEGHKGWIFPGGKVFTFLDVNCSDFFDLIAYIKYADIHPS